MIKKMKISIKSEEQIKKMRISGRLAAEVLEMIEPFVVPGVSTEELDRRCIGSVSAVLESRVISKFDEWTDKLDKKFEEKFKGQERLATTEGNMFDLTNKSSISLVLCVSTFSSSFITIYS